MTAITHDIKTCRKCGISKPLHEFYKHSEMLDGHLNHCKECVKSSVSDRIKTKKLDPDWVRNERNRCRIKSANARRAGNVINSTFANKEWRQRNPQKRRAHGKAYRALKRGILKKPDACQKCSGVGPLQMHHPDYSKPLEVVFLCSACHGMEHRLDKIAA